MGSCRMGYGVGDAVCDERGRVFSGLELTGARLRPQSAAIPGLRIGDLSLALSAPPDTHVMRVALAIGERIAELVLEEYEHP